VRRKGLNLWDANFGWVATIVVENIALCPLDVGFLTAIGTMLEADGVGRQVEELLRFGADASLIGAWAS
jgi:hypothetical protein